MAIGFCGYPDGAFTSITATTPITRIDVVLALCARSLAAIAVPVMLAVAVAAQPLPETSPQVAAQVQVRAPELAQRGADPHRNRCSLGYDA